MSAALQLVKPAPYSPPPKVLTATAITHLSCLNDATRRLRGWGIKVEKINPHSSRYDCPVITIRRVPNETFRPLLDASVLDAWVGKVCFVRLSGCIVTWVEP